MAWLGKVTLGNFGDLAGAVSKLSESVKNIEKNFDSALGFEAKAESPEDEVSLLPSESEKTELIPASVTQSQESDNTSEDAAAQSATSDQDARPSLIPESSKTSSANDEQSDNLPYSDSREKEERREETLGEEGGDLQKPLIIVEDLRTNAPSEEARVEEEGYEVTKEEESEKNLSKEVPDFTASEDQASLSSTLIDHHLMPENAESNNLIQREEERHQNEEEESLPSLNVSVDVDADVHKSEPTEETKAFNKISKEQVSNGVVSPPDDPPLVLLSSRSSIDIEKEEESTEKLKEEARSLEAALQGAAKQAQIKADEISRLLIENEQLKAMIEDAKRRSNEAELEALKEEFKERLGATERKVYALTRERDMLRREQSKKNDSSVLLKEKDEIIKQVMAEGEELSRKQAAQEAQIRKLRAQIREIDEEKQRLNSKIQVDEARVESIKKDKANTERALQEAVERSQAELAAQKEFYTHALNEAKEAEANARARADTGAKIELERRLREAGERETALAQALEELRQALSRVEQQSAFREDMLRRDNEDLQRRCQAAEVRYEELVARVPESTRPLLRQIQAMQETSAMQSETWSGLERALNARLQEAEMKAASAQERERAMNERMTQTLSRTAMLEAQISCLKAEQSQLTRSLEKERQRAADNRLEYLAASEAAATQEGRAKQMEEELKELQKKYKHDLAEERTLRELLEKDIEHERKTRVDYEKQLQSQEGAQKVPISLTGPQLDYSLSRGPRHFSSVSSAGSIEESYYLQASLDSTLDQLAGDRMSTSNPMLSPQIMKGLVSTATLEQLESQLHQKEGELASYTSRLRSLESTRDSLAEELVKTTTECEKFRSEVSAIPRLRAELDSLRHRHVSALELMGERDEQVEELRADLADVKQMYREQIDMLVNQIEKLSASVA